LAEAVKEALASRHPVAVAAAAAAAAAAGAGAAAVVAFGEYHQTVATAHIPSALRRFCEEILPTLAPPRTPASPVSGGGAASSAGPGVELSHLVVETWVTTGRCGEAERIVTDDVQRAIQRPAATEGEIETLLRVAAAHRVVPRILSVSCADYQAMRSTAPDEKGAAVVDYDRTLRITARALEHATLAALRERRDQPSASRAVAVYGGALHNDVHPDPSLAGYSFAPALLAATLGRFVEIDLVVPEYAAGSPALRAQPWWPVYLRALRTGANGDPALRRGPGQVAVVPAVVMVRRSPRSFVVVFPRTSVRR
jgi:hypothetical protein